MFVNSSVEIDRLLKLPFALVLLVCSSVNFLSAFPKPQAPSPKDGTVNAMSFGCAADGIADDAPCLNRAIAAIGSGHGGTLTIPPGKYLLNAVSSDAYGNHVILLDHMIHLHVMGYGATLIYEAKNNSARVIELRGSASCVLEGFKLESANAGVGTGFSLRRPVVSYGDPVQKNHIHDIEVQGFNIGIEMGTPENNQVSENSVDNVISSANTTHIVQQGKDTFNNLFENITFYTARPGQTFLDLYNGTATFIRPTFEQTRDHVTSIKIEPGFVGPVEFIGAYCEWAETSEPFLVWNSGGAYVVFIGGQLSFFGAGGNEDAPRMIFDLTGQRSGGSLSFLETNMSTPNAGVRAIALPSLNGQRQAIGPQVTRTGGYWGDVKIQNIKP